MTTITDTDRTITPIHETEPRNEVRVTFPDGRVFSAPIGTPLAAFVNEAYPASHPEYPMVAAIVNQELRELTLPIRDDANVKPINMTTGDGNRIYRRSLIFVLTTAANELFPGVKIAVQHALLSGGFHCEVIGRDPFTENELEQLRQRMQAIIDADEPITRQEMPLDEARAYFEARNDDDKVRLLEYRPKPYLTLYTLRGNMDYFYGYMTASTGALSLFDLAHAKDSFILRFARAETYGTLQPVNELPQLERIFIQTRRWLDVMGIEDIGRLNQSIARDDFREEVLIAEALQTRHLNEIARAIAERHAQGARLVLIAGPSSAGKTTFSKRLAIQLMAYGIQPYTLAMDNYFVDRELTPRDENGGYDFEALDALDRVRLDADLQALMRCETVQLPLFDFKTGKSRPGEICQLTEQHIIIAEGIHALNPSLLPEISPERFFRVYVSPLTVLNIDRHNRIPTTDVRLLRRMVRDAAHRGYDAQATLDRWESVRRGEKRNIFPYQENADMMFNSSLMYELAVIRPFAEPLLRQVDHKSPRYTEVKRLLAFLSWVRPAKAEFVPDDSLLREFIGGSIFEGFLPGLRSMSNRAADNGTLF